MPRETVRKRKRMARCRVTPDGKARMQGAKKMMQAVVTNLGQIRLGHGAAARTVHPRQCTKI